VKIGPGGGSKWIGEF